MSFVKGKTPKGSTANIFRDKKITELQQVFVLQSKS